MSNPTKTSKPDSTVDAWAILFLIILIRGGGPYSVDRALGKEF